MALYGYRFNLPEGLSDTQKKQLESLAIETARKASVVSSGRFKKGWRVKITGDTLVVDTKVPYAVYVERGMGYNKNNRYKVRDALNKIGFDTMFDSEIGSLIVPAVVGATTASAITSQSSPSSSSNTAQDVQDRSTIERSPIDPFKTPAELRRDLIESIRPDISRNTPSLGTINTPPNLNLFNRSYLLALIAAGLTYNEITEEDQDGK